MTRLKFAHIILIIFLLGGCTTNQNVRGALPSKTPNIFAGAGVGTVAGAAAQGFIGKTKSVVPGMLAGAMLGAAVASYADTQGLVNRLNAQGVNIIVIGDSVEIIIPTDLVFYGNDTEVKLEAYSMLEEVVKYIKQYGKSAISVAVHTDNVDNSLYRLNQTAKQAQSFTTFLWSHGINLQRMKFDGKSNFEPVADFQSATGAGYNRRIQISIWREDFRAPSPFYVYTANQNEECWKSDNPETCQ